jgi:hypothetical protein
MWAARGWWTFRDRTALDEVADSIESSASSALGTDERSPSAVSAGRATIRGSDRSGWDAGANVPREERTTPMEFSVGTNGSPPD